MAPIGRDVQNFKWTTFVKCSKMVKISKLAQILKQFEVVKLPKVCYSKRLAKIYQNI